MTMESTQMTPGYYHMVCSNGMVSPNGEKIMFNPKEVFQLMEQEEEDEAIGVCANCPHIGQCSEPVPLDCPIND